MQLLEAWRSFVLSYSSRIGKHVVVSYSFQLIRQPGLCSDILPLPFPRFDALARPFDISEPRKLCLSRYIALLASPFNCLYCCFASDVLPLSSTPLHRFAYSQILDKLLLCVGQLDKFSHKVNFSGAFVHLAYIGHRLAYPDIRVARPLLLCRHGAFLVSRFPK